MRSLITVMAVLVALSACGNDDPEPGTGPASPVADTDAPADGAATDPAPGPADDSSLADEDLAPPEYPTCESVFVEGDAMPETAIAGCYDADANTIVPSTTEDCADGSTLVVSPRGYGIIGQDIHVSPPGEDTDTSSGDYQAVYEECVPS